MNQTSIIIVLAFILGVFIYSQLKFKNKMLCYFIRPNKTRIRKFVPMYFTHVELNRGKYGKEWYRIIWKYVTHEYYTGGINKLFPVWIPTFEFYWNNPNPVDPETGKPSWHTPEVEAAGYQGHGYTAFAKAAVQQAGLKQNKILQLIPLIVLGVILIMAIVGYQYLESLNFQIGALQQKINLIPGVH